MRRWRRGSDFDEAAFDRELQDWERRWADQHESYPTRTARRFDQSVAAAMGEISSGTGQAVCARRAQPDHRQAGDLFERPSGPWRRLGQRWQAEQHGELLGHGCRQRQRPVVASGPGRAGEGRARRGGRLIMATSAITGSPSRCPMTASTGKPWRIAGTITNSPPAQAIPADSPRARPATRAHQGRGALPADKPDATSTDVELVATKWERWVGRGEPET